MQFKPCPSHTELQRSLDRFAALLAKPYAPERDFHDLFTDCPFILTRSLPLRLESWEVVAAKPGEALPDLLLYPSDSQIGARTPIPVELKKVTTRILRQSRKNSVILTSDAATGVRQCQDFLRDARLTISPNAPLFVGDDRFAFVIAGLTRELREKVTAEISLDDLLPPGVRIVPYDHLFDLYARGVPPRVFFAFNDGARWAEPKAVTITFSKHDMPLVFRITEDMRAAGLSITLDCFTGSGRGVVGALARTALRGDIVVLSVDALRDVDTKGTKRASSEEIAESLKRFDSAEPFQVLSLDSRYSDALVNFYLSENPQAKLHDWSRWDYPGEYGPLFTKLLGSL